MREGKWKKRDSIEVIAGDFLGQAILPDPEGKHR